MYFRRFDGKKSRLILPEKLDTNDSEEGSWIPIDMDFLKHLWVPNVFVYNLVSFHALDCLKKLAGLWIVGGKDLFYNQVIFFNNHLPIADS